MKISHYMESGVAWVPGRIAELLKDDDEFDVRLYARNPVGTQRYGLPTMGVLPAQAAHAVPESDIIHLHHALVAVRQVTPLRKKYPKAKIIVTLHGEPDRSRGVPPDLNPDAFHVVEPGLLKLVEGKAPPIVKYLPNHPSFEPDAVIQRARGTRLETLARSKDNFLFVPYSLVNAYKDPQQRDAVMMGLVGSGWRTQVDSKIQPNGLVLDTLREATACWVQLQGYVDVLTYECWEAGCVPIVREPGPDELRVMLDFFGTLPKFLFENNVAEDIVAILNDDTQRDPLYRAYESPWSEAQRANQTWMRTVWSREKARDAWRSFYREVAG